MNDNTIKLVKWCWRRVDFAVDFWFTVWLWWINKPVFKWVFLALLILSIASLAEAEKEDESA